MIISKLIEGLVLVGIGFLFVWWALRNTEEDTNKQNDERRLNNDRNKT
jgi:hypothetical protein